MSETSGIRCMWMRGGASKGGYFPGAVSTEITIPVEHSTGEFTVIATLDAQGQVARAGVPRTARKLFEGVVF